MNTGIQLPKERVARLDPADVEAYLRTHGWEEDRSNSAAKVGSFRYGPDQEVTVLVPRDRGFLDYAVRLGDVLHTLAAIEHRPIWEVLETLLAGRIHPAPNGPAVRNSKAADGSLPRRAKKDAS